MKNILIVTSALEIGGAERVIANLVRHIDTTRYRVSVCHLKERGVIGDELARDGYAVFGIRRFEDPVRRYLSFLGLREVVKKHKIQLIHSHTTYSLVDSSLCRLTTAGLRTVHTFHRGNYPNHRPRYMRMERVFSKVSDCLVSVGIEQGKSICSTYQLDPSAIRTVLNGVQDLQLSPDPDWAARLRQNGRVVVGSISTLIEQKGLPFLLDALVELKRRGHDPLLVIVGEGELRQSLEAKTRQLDLVNSVIFTGWIQQAAVRLLPLFDVFVQSSLWEAMSMVVLEAMAAAKPVVVTDVGDNRHVVENGNSGYVVPPKNVAAMADAIETLVRSSERRQQFGAAARSRFLANYTSAEMARRYEAIYDELLKS